MLVLSRDDTILASPGEFEAVSAATIQAWFVARGPQGANYVGLPYLAPPPDLGSAIATVARETGIGPAKLAGQIADETAYWQSTYARERNNPGGIGAINSAPDEALYFPTVEAGVRAHAAHLMVYLGLKLDTYYTLDPRAANIKAQGWVGTVQFLKDLEQKWAWSPDAVYRATPVSQRYGAEIAARANDLITFSAGVLTMTSIPTSADIGYPVSVVWAHDQGGSRTLASVKWFVVHKTEGNEAGDIPTLTGAGAPVASVHAWISRDGHLIFMTPLEIVAWACANGGVDQVGVSVELEGMEDEPTTDAQYHALSCFFVWCRGRGLTVPNEYVGKDERPGIIGHEDVGDGAGGWGGRDHHADPGPLFDFGRLTNEIAALLTPNTPPVPQPPVDPTVKNVVVPGLGTFTIGGGFLQYYKQFGGFDIDGYPISNEMQENGVTVQYFERARYEWHPHVWPERFDVLRGRVGAELMESRAEIARLRALLPAGVQ